jgi:hypothetical protein
VSFTINQPATVYVSFDYRIMRIGNSGSDLCVSASGGGACPQLVVDGTSPETFNNGDGQICFTLRDTAGVTYNSAGRVEVDQSNNIALQVVSPACTPTTQQLPTNANYTPCSRRYNFSGGTGAGAFSDRPRVQFNFAGAGPLTFNQIGFKMWVPGGGNAFEMWLDNVLVQPVVPGAAIGGIAGWRDCAVSACPAV